MSDASLLAALALGLAGAGHCLGMCGGIASALNLGGPAGASSTVSYHLGRILSYTLLGGLFGALAGSIQLANWLIALRYLAGFLLIGMGLYVAQWWLGMQRLERAGAKLWQPVQRISSSLLPVRRPSQALGLGLCWGLMPCGLIYSSLAWATTAASASHSALLMFCFGLGTLPSMLAASASAGKVRAFLQHRQLKSVIGGLLILAGLWTLYQVATHGEHILASEGPEAHHHHH